MNNKALILEVHEAIKGKTVNQISKQKIAYLYKKVTGNEMKKDCSNCIDTAFEKVYTYYRANRSLIESIKLFERILYICEREEKYYLCKFIKEKLL